MKKKMKIHLLTGKIILLKKKKWLTILSLKFALSNDIVYLEKKKTILTLKKDQLMEYTT